MYKAQDPNFYYGYKVVRVLHPKSEIAIEKSKVFAS